MKNLKNIEWVLRIGVFGEFLGHGILALQGKEGWVGWIMQFGVSDPAYASDLLYLIGLVDIILAFLVLLRPIRSALLWMTLWGFWTAALRPIVGESIWDFVERSANWAAPLALFLLLPGTQNVRDFFCSNKK